MDRMLATAVEIDVPASSLQCFSDPFGTNPSGSVTKPTRGSVINRSWIGHQSFNEIPGFAAGQGVTIHYGRVCHQA